MSTVKLTTLKDLTDANPSTPEQISQGRAKAWVVFTTITTTTIYDDYNVASLTDGGTGITTITFDTAMSTANYAWGGTAQGSGVANIPADVCMRIGVAPTTSALAIQVNDGTSALVDRDRVCAIVFGD
jgi:hypothetical protein